MCCFVFLNQYWGIVKVPGFPRASQGGTHPHPRLRIANVPPHPILPQTTWGGRILTLHLKSHVRFWIGKKGGGGKGEKQLNPTLADCKWRAAVPGLKPLRLPRAPLLAIPISSSSSSVPLSSNGPARSPYQNLVRGVSYKISDFGRGGRAVFWKFSAGMVQGAIARRP